MTHLGKQRSITATLALVAGLFGMNLAAAPEVGAPAPAFAVADIQGEIWTLDHLQGKPAILEWTNHDCPYVHKHYDSGNMQRLQRKAAEQGLPWLSVISSAPGKQGHVSPKQADELTASREAAPTAVLLDESGDMGRAYGASTTPHIFIINAEGTLIYMGGIDDKGTTDVADIEGATNYVDLALAELADGKPLSTAVTRPYGCSVKY
ncbi:redoxin domain-containing protein [Thiorhodovibrio frisius]|uniref:Peroxiredoxin n=1 Tax=Thiorhodovibrio frisius TaxID=631362 RepID=H8Z4G3_9GAMM|nr:redoxin domain-containing protein [Thiorhodovibrio frisius]EIC20220.1 Peroxiredoxin [Thiorhodovibrio frisius]WPL20958.1 AhpC/TSA family protein [Thiorhodovibrio frisius]